MDIAIIILHYQTYDDTVECVNSILNLIDTQSFHIVIVDNCSSNGSGKRLANEYIENNHISVIINDKNLGFSKGFNIGINYVRNKFDPNYIVLSNSDIVLLTKNLVTLLKKINKTEYYSLIGPMIITHDGRCDVNPIRNSIRTKQEAQHVILKDKINYLLAVFHLTWIYNLLRKIRGTDNKIKDPDIYLNDQQDYQLHGAFWIFTRAYFRVFEGLDEGPFLYGEESLLFLHLKMNNLHTLYTPEIMVYHKEDSSTNSTFPKSTEKIKFASKHGIESVKYYIGILDDYCKTSQSFERNK